MTAGPGAVAPAAARDLPFVGREAPLAALVTAVQAAELGEHVVGLVAGEPGIGKTRLVKELAARVQSRVLRAAAWQGEGAPAYWLWLQVLRGLGAPAADTERLLRERQDDAADDTRFWLFDAVAEAVARASQDEPLVVVLEDLHWADEASVRLLEFFASDLRPRRVAVVGTYRDTDLDRASPLVHRLGEIARAGLHLSLGGLGRRDVESLLTAVPDTDAALGPVLHRKSGGNPLFLRELVALLAADGAVDDVAGLAPLVERRLARLSTGARSVLLAAATAGPDIDVPLLAAVTDLPDERLLAGLDEARAVGLVTPVDHDRVEFVHALVREVLYDGAPLAERAALHARLASAIERRHGPERLPEIAHHVLRSGTAAGAGRAVDVAVQAADHALGLLAFEQAAEWYGRALELVRAGHRSERTVDALLLRRGEAQLAAGDLPAARATFVEAAAAARARGDAEQLAHAALGLGTGFGGFEVKLLDPVQVELLEEALAALDPSPSFLRACVLARLSVALSFMGADERRTALAEQAVAVAREVGDPAVLGYALTGHCDAVAGPAHCDVRLAESAEAVRLAGQAGDRRLELLGRRLRLVALLETGDVAGVDEEIERFAVVATQLRQPLYRWYVPLWRGMRELMRGDLDAAARRCAEAEEIGARAGSENAVYLVFAQRWVLARYEGRFDEAGRGMAQLVEAGEGEPAQTPAGWPYPAIVALMLGEVDRARGLLEQWLDGGIDRRPRDSEWLPESAQLAQAAVASGSRRVAEVLYEQLQPYAALCCVEGIGAACTGPVTWYLAELARFLGHDAEAARYAADAAASSRRLGLHLDPPPLAATSAPETSPPPMPAGEASLLQEGPTWAVTWGGTTARLRDGKGLRDLAVLLTRPDEEVHCLELVGGADVGGSTGPVIDAQARRAYERRIRDLQEDIDEARADNDPARAERAEAELDALVHQLSEAFGLSGRDRATGSAAERARSAVGWRVRAALRQVAEAHPALGRHLQNAVRTGTWCSYRPETAVRWTVGRAQGRSA